VINRKNSPTSILPALVIFAVASLCAVPQVWGQTVAGSISALTGSATITRGGATFPAADGAKVEVGDRIVTGTGSNVAVALSDGSQIEVTDSSNLTIDETLNPDGSRASTRVSLLTGMVRSLVRSTAGTPPNFEVLTPNAVASARGTSFDVDYRRN
jgi:hypothetical protein